MLLGYHAILHKKNISNRSLRFYVTVGRYIVKIFIFPGIFKTYLKFSKGDCFVILD